MEWQPIETCPRDGSEFLAYDSKAGKMDVCVAYVYPGGFYVCQVQCDRELGAAVDQL